MSNERTKYIELTSRRKKITVEYEEMLSFVDGEI